MGPGIGYGLAEHAEPIYLSSNGTDWMPVGGGLALLYETVPAAAKAGGTGILFQRDEVPVWTTSLSRPQPNPFNPRTELAFTLAAGGKVTLMVYNLRGQKVATLVDAELDAGPHTAVWEGGLDVGGRAASGVYLARLRAAGTIHQRRLVLLK